jgi:hypothetical protein
VSSRREQLAGHSQLDRVVRRVDEVLPSPEISLGSLHRCMTEKHLDLLKLSARGSAQLRARTAPMPHAA